MRSVHPNDQALGSKTDFRLTAEDTAITELLAGLAQPLVESFRAGHQLSTLNHRLPLSHVTSANVKCWSQT